MDEFRQLVDAIRDHGLVTVATPFDEQSVQACQALNVQVLKLASCSATDWPLISAMINANRPVIASTGGLGIYDIDNLVSHLHKRVPAFALMHCVSLYPAPDERIHMNFLSKIMRRYPYVLTGYSGHEAPDNNEVTMAAIAKGASLLERHVGYQLRKSSSTPIRLIRNRPITGLQQPNGCVLFVGRVKKNTSYNMKGRITRAAAWRFRQTSCSSRRKDHARRCVLRNALLGRAAYQW